MLKPGWNLQQSGKGGLGERDWRDMSNCAEVNAFFLHFYVPDIDSAMKWIPFLTLVLKPADTPTRLQAGWIKD